MGYSWLYREKLVTESLILVTSSVVTHVHLLFREALQNKIIAGITVIISSKWWRYSDYDIILASRPLKKLHFLVNNYETAACIQTQIQILKICFDSQEI